MTDPALPPLPSLTGLPSLAGLPALPTLGPVGRRPPVDGARRNWQQATVLDIHDETPRARSFRLSLAGSSARHVPGQHYDVRLRAPDGSTAQRSYSIASAPAVGMIELTVERIADGDVSPYLHDVIKVGDSFEVRGPFGGWFIWAGDSPALLVGGGSGVVPLISMRRYWAQLERPVPLHLVVAVRTPQDLFFAGEYGDETTLTYSRQSPAGDPRPPGHLDAATLQSVLGQLPAQAFTAYVCGSAGFAEHASQLLVGLGVDRSAVRVERFGPS